MDMDSFIGNQEIFTKVIFFKIFDMEKDKCCGIMEIFIEVNGIKECKTDMASYFCKIIKF
jgi:hypothetical protein